ncbi:MAG: HNH endonuclease signature motif containing protein [Ignavibacteriales bacterium]|nr:HNH endonuclease signature motif containing protein [Ignavibacteriales bacterium]
MKPDDIISYLELINAEKAHLQKGMNYRIGKNYSIFLMSVRKNAPYADQINNSTGALLYEGHDHPKTKAVPDPKAIDQPMTTKTGAWTENGKFFKAATDYKTGLVPNAELIKVYEKIANGIWCYKGFFELVDVEKVPDGKRKVFKFHLLPVAKTMLHGNIELPHNRIIPTHVKVEVWKRDKGKCQLCNSNKNLHYDHVIPFSKGGSSLTSKNIRLLCARHNLEKSDKIMAIFPWISVGAAALAIHRQN